VNQTRGENCLQNKQKTLSSSVKTFLEKVYKVVIPQEKEYELCMGDTKKGEGVWSLSV